MLNRNGIVFPIVAMGRFGHVVSSFNYRRIWLLGFGVWALNLAGCGCTLVPPGFVCEHWHGICKGWLDYNTHRRPSITFERYDHLPPNSARVKLFRWTHAGSVDQPRIVPYREAVVYREGSRHAGD